MKIPRPLDAAELRVLGALLEKEQTTPDLYPLTVNSLVAACNQRSNREPVMDLSASDVEATLERLHEDVLVWPVSGSRSQRWRHNLDRRWELEPTVKAVLTLLLLRGAQTPGELRGRTDRLHAFATTEEVELVLTLLGDGPEPLVVRLGRRPGQKESRWAHLVGGTVADEPEAAATWVAEPRGGGLADRVHELEERVARLEEILARLTGSAAS
jgi:uncharacterized protein YceH (UPF0502 family)